MKTPDVNLWPLFLYVQTCPCAPTNMSTHTIYSRKLESLHSWHQHFNLSKAVMSYYLPWTRRQCSENSQHPPLSCDPVNLSIMLWERNNVALGLESHIRDIRQIGFLKIQRLTRQGSFLFWPRGQCKFIT